MKEGEAWYHNPYTIWWQLRSDLLMRWGCGVVMCCEGWDHSKGFQIIAISNNYITLYSMYSLIFNLYSIGILIKSHLLPSLLGNCKRSKVLLICIWNNKNNFFPKINSPNTHQLSSVYSVHGSEHESGNVQKKITRVNLNYIHPYMRGRGRRTGTLTEWRIKFLI